MECLWLPFSVSGVGQVEDRWYLTWEDGVSVASFLCLRCWPGGRQVVPDVGGWSVCGFLSLSQVLARWKTGGS